jgi:hypothetical protein
VSCRSKCFRVNAARSSLDFTNGTGRICSPPAIDRRDRNPKSLLGLGERKSLQTDRVILVPGPYGEIDTIAKHLSDKPTMRQLALISFVDE